MWTTRKNDEPPVESPLEPNRRAIDRFPIVREVRYRVVSARGTAEAGTGTTVNISSSGVLFTAQTPLPVGRRLELSINWPAQLPGKVLLKLVVHGRIVRCQGTEVAIRIEDHEFRTTGRHAT